MNTRIYSLWESSIAACVFNNNQHFVTDLYPNLEFWIFQTQWKRPIKKPIWEAENTPMTPLGPFNNNATWKKCLMDVYVEVLFFCLSWREAGLHLNNISVTRLKPLYSLHATTPQRACCRRSYEKTEQGGSTSWTVSSNREGTREGTGHFQDLKMIIS